MAVGSAPLLQAGIRGPAPYSRLGFKQRSIWCCCSRPELLCPNLVMLISNNRDKRRSTLNACHWGHQSPQTACGPNLKPLQTRQGVICRGILDHYRREMGLTVEPKIRIPPEEEYDDSEDLECPVDCVREIFTEEELQQQLSGAPPGTLVVVDFYKTGCGSCRYILPGFVKICKASGSGDVRHVVFLKHNVVGEEEELTDLALKLDITGVPKFHFYKDGELVDAFTTREKAIIIKAINKHAGYEVLQLPSH
eukprot:jgi/Botrbrau1/20619/Bobra.113_1s0044.2